ncbi:hypothetical protein VP01_3139g3 [Puccinia sorghi]|uniref:Reverse transcriptase Ty1/copia-type domain-containing protein n=1 Tax=Puccinia sorghi TaxID=27349 RepID=A0A0L6V0V3_9BASI|nr:hypothetical protein VP01_3139g3 [Puccinia sorghi]
MQLMLKWSFKESACNPCMYACNDGVSFIFFHVDDLVLVGPGNNFKKKFADWFSNSACHPPNTLLGMKFEKKLGSLSASLALLLSLLTCNSEKPLTMIMKTSNTRPDLSFAVSSLARYSVKPGLSHWKEVKKTWQYLCHTKDLKFTIYPTKPTEFLSIYSDATWGDDPDCRTSQSGYLCYIFGSLFSWNSCRQCSITYSSTKAELNPLVESFHKGAWLKALINEVWNLQIESAAHFIDDEELNQQLTVDDKTFKELYCTNHLIDNKGLNDKLKKFRSNSKNRHIDVRTKGLRQEIKNKNIKITLVKTQDMIADALTKPTSIGPLRNLIKTVDSSFAHQP